MKEALPPLLERTAAVLADSARLLLQIEDSIAPLLARPVRDPAAAPVSFRASAASLQKIDLLSQTLEDLSFWLDDLATESRNQISGTISVESAMARLRLADLRQRLNGGILAAHDADRSETVLF